MRKQAASHDATAQTLVHLRSRPTALLLHYIRRHTLGHALILAAVLAAVLCAVGTQYGLKRLVDAVTQGHAAGAGPAWSAFVVLCGLIAADNLLWRLGGVAAAHVFVAVSGDVRRDLFGHLSGHAPSYFAERLPGALASRISATANAMFTALNTGAWNVLPPCIAVCVSIALVITVNPVMAATLGVAGLLLAGLIFALARRGVPLHHAYALRAAALDGELVDVVGNMGVVRAFGATLRERARMADSVAGEMAARRASLLYLERLRLIHAIVTAIMAAGLIAWGLHLWDIGQASPGDIVLIASLGLTILNSTRDLAVALVDLTQHVARLQEATQALLLPHTLPDADGAPALRQAQGRAQGRVVFDHVAFAYTGRAPVLRDFNLAIEAGTRVGLVGVSGAGKSTVLALLQRFYDAQGGRILIDGQDITRVTQDSLHQLIAVVPQDVSLFHRSVLENIRYARPEASEAEVLHAAAMAQCGFLEALPEGYETIVGDRGVKLSGGQRQRLAIARAILKDAPILLLDEATSALDSESERAIQAALDHLMRGRTVVAVAHRLSTLQSFDRIIVMDQGRIIDDGAPRALAGRPGPYRDRLRLQDQLPVAA